MKDSKTLFAEFLQSNPHPEQLSDDQLRNALADIFKGDKDSQDIVISLIKTGNFFSLSAANVDVLASSYANVLRIDKDKSLSIVTLCLSIRQEPTQKTDSLQETSVKQSTPKKGKSPQRNSQWDPSWDSVRHGGMPIKGEYINARGRDGKQKQLDAHPRIPYPKYTFKDNIDDYGGTLYEELFRPLLCAVFGFGIPTYLITWLFNHFDIGGWNVYVWCIYGVICLYVLFKGIADFLKYKSPIDDMRNEDYYQLNHLTKYFYKKGITARAEKIMKDVYNEVRANKDRYEPVRSCEMIERAYQDAFEYVLCYFNDDDRWLYLEANEEYRKGIGDWDFGVYRSLYTKYYYNAEYYKKPFDFMDYEGDIFGDCLFNRPNWL